MRRAARRVVEKLRASGHEAFFAGGWVRDQLLGRKATDIDIATSATPDEVMKIFPRAIPVGARYGVVQVRYYRQCYEVTTFRTDGAYTDGRHPVSVVFSDSRQDALRRDFTVNGIFFDPISSRFIDFVRGRADIHNRMIRTIGDPHARFSEDRLRMLRAVRLACNLGFEVAAETMDALRAQASEIGQVSGERIRDEILKILRGEDPARGLDLLHSSGLMRHVLPEIDAMRGVEQPPEYHPEGDVFVHTKLMLSLLRKPTTTLALGALLHDVGKPPTFTIRERIRFDGHVEVGAEMAAEICGRLRLSRSETDQVVDLVLNHLRFMNVKEMRESTLRRFLCKPNFAEHLEMHRADCLSSHGNLDSYHFCKQRLAEIRKEPVPLPRLLTGHDLIELGYTPGPIFSRIIVAVEDLQMEKKIGSREEALEFVKTTFPEP